MRDSKDGVSFGGTPALRPAAALVMRQPHGYSKAIVLRDAGWREMDEIIVAAAVTKYSAGCESAVPDVASGGAATQIRIIGKLVCRTPRRSAGPRRPYEPEAERVVDATPMKKSRDAMIPTAAGFVLPTSYRYGNAPPAAPRAAAAARLGVLPKWQSACLSTPPTPRRLGSL